MSPVQQPPPRTDTQGQIQQELLQRALELSTDPRIQEAIKLLPQEYRPTVPIYEYDDPRKLYEEVLRPRGEAELSPNAIGAALYDKSAIYVNKKLAESTNPYVLASKLAHEQAHISQDKFDRRESPAYERELDFVMRNSPRFPANYASSLEQLLKKYRAEEERYKKEHQK